MRKLITKRIRITKNGKMIHRHAGHNHFNAKASRRVQQRRNQNVTFSKTMQRNITQMLGK